MCGVFEFSDFAQKISKKSDSSMKFQKKFTKEFPSILIWVYFTKDFHVIFFFTGKSFVKFFPIFKLESDFFPHFLSKIRKLENCENLFILNFQCAKFQEKKKLFWISFIHDHSLRSFFFKLGQSR